MFCALRPVLARGGWPGLGAILLLCRLGNVLGAHNGGRMAATLVLVAVGAIGLAWGGAMPCETLRIRGLAGAAVLLLAGFERAAPPLLRRVGQYLGDHTYGLYLWHVSVQMAIMLVLLPHRDPAELAQSGWFLAAFMLGTIALARVASVLVKHPMRE